MKIHDPQQLELPLRFPPTMAVLQRELRGARQELHNLQVMQMKPGSAERLELLRKLEVSCRAEVKLRRRAIGYARRVHHRILERLRTQPPP